jgi:predicted flavoprotein YhiN
VPGLYLAGEILDVDGPCGGYNLSWAFASGLVAGRSAVRSLTEN